MPDPAHLSIAQKRLLHSAWSVGSTWKASSFSTSKTQAIPGYTLWIGVTVSTTYPAYSSLRDAEERGNLSVVEGTVSNFHRGGGFSKERFCVDSRCFQYTPETVPVTFMNSTIQGGPIISNGLRVRIASAGEAIVRLEIVGDRQAALR
jgi:hypothetical protein